MIHAAALTPVTVATLTDPVAHADPAAAELAAWALVHGFATLWLNDAINPGMKTTDPATTVQRIAGILFPGGDSRRVRPSGD